MFQYNGGDDCPDHGPTVTMIAPGARRNRTATPLASAGGVVILCRKRTAGGTLG
jgi:hypothetical protein